MSSAISSLRLGYEIGRTVCSRRHGGSEDGDAIVQSMQELRLRRGIDFIALETPLNR